jgi:hypothetical protein
VFCEKVKQSREMFRVGRKGTEDRCAEWDGEAEKGDVLRGKVGHRREMC